MYIIDVVQNITDYSDTPDANLADFWDSLNAIYLDASHLFETSKTSKRIYRLILSFRTTLEYFSTFFN